MERGVTREIARAKFSRPIKQMARYDARVVGRLQRESGGMLPSLAGFLRTIRRSLIANRISSARAQQRRDRFSGNPERTARGTAAMTHAATTTTKTPRVNNNPSKQKTKKFSHQERGRKHLQANSVREGFAQLGRSPPVRRHPTGVKGDAPGKSTGRQL